MDAIHVTACLAIHEGKLEEFKELAAQCVQLVRERDSGTLQYDWFFNDTTRAKSTTLSKAITTGDVEAKGWQGRHSGGPAALGTALRYQGSVPSSVLSRGAGQCVVR